MGKGTQLFLLLVNMTSEESWKESSSVTRNETQTERSNEISNYNPASEA